MTAVRPPFTDEENHLYKTALPNFAERDAFRFLRAGKLTTAQAGSVLMTQGTPVRTLSLIVDGEVSVEINGAEVDSLGGSRFLGQHRLSERPSELFHARDGQNDPSHASADMGVCRSGK